MATRFSFFIKKFVNFEKSLEKTKNEFQYEDDVSKKAEDQNDFGAKDSKDNIEWLFSI